MSKIVIEINKCDECPFVKVERTWNAGLAYDYNCTKANKQIDSYIESPSELRPVPNWCPCLLKKKAFCINCDNDVEFIKDETISWFGYNEHKIRYPEQVAICSQCGEQIYVPEVNDENCKRREQALKTFKAKFIV